MKLNSIMVFMACTVRATIACASCDDGLAAYEVKDYATALSEFKSPLCKDNPQVQNKLGVMYTNAEGVIQDFQQAAKWFRLAANQGLAAGQSNLGVMYNNGNGVKQDYREAAKWYRLAAGQGRSSALIIIADYYSSGTGVKKIKWVAYALYKLAAQNADAKLGEYDLNRAKTIVRNLESMPTQYEMSGKDIDKGVELFELLQKTPSKLNEQLVRIENEEAGKPQEKIVLVTGVSVIPGAIVCKDFNTVQLMFKLYAMHWEDSQRDQLTNGKSKLIDGPPTPVPNLSKFGCNLIPVGNSVTLHLGNPVPIVTAKLPNGRSIQGVTLPSMIGM